MRKWKRSSTSNCDRKWTFGLLLVFACSSEGSGHHPAAFNQDPAADPAAADGRAGGPAPALPRGVLQLRDADAPPETDGGMGSPSATDAGAPLPADGAAGIEPVDAAEPPEEPPPLDDEGTCDPCWTNANPPLSDECPPTHRCVYDGFTSGLKFCLPSATFCAQEYINGPYKVPPFVGGEYLTSYGAGSSSACGPDKDHMRIGCAAWRELVGIPE